MEDERENGATRQGCTEPGGGAEADLARDGWLSVAQAAERLASSRRMVTRWAVNGKLGDVRPGQTGRGKGMRVSAKAVQAMVADRANELGKRVAREAQRKAILDQRQREPAINDEGSTHMSKRNLNWMLDLVRTLSDMADETLISFAGSEAEARDAQTVLDGITNIEDLLKRIRDRRFQDDSGEEGGEG
ncbi:MAG TPA: hypothetical protein VFJ58_29510 [Armatimonadota bacterium]|nr:hypothetical protein [Armatimonadota bacterium]